jgi:hypothetical protein
VVLIREGLDHALHEVLLCQRVLAYDDDVQDPRQDDLLVDVVSNAFEAAQTNDVFANGDAKFIPLNFSLLAVFMGGQVLEAHPESVHFRHVLEDEFDGVVNVATFSLILVALVWQDVFHHLQEVVP